MGTNGTAETDNAPRQLHVNQPLVEIFADSLPTITLKGHNMTPLEELASLLADEEKGAVSLALAGRISAIKDRPDGPVRIRIFAAASMIGGAELMAQLEGPEAAARQLRRLAERFEAGTFEAGTGAPMN